MRAQEPDNGKWEDVPDDFGDETPQTLDLEIDESVEGTLGQVFKGKKEGSYYRVLTTEEGEKYFVGGADLQRLMKYPTGTLCRLTLTGTLDTGKGNPMKKYRVQVAQGQDSDLPF